MNSISEYLNDNLIEHHFSKQELNDYIDTIDVILENDSNATPDKGWKLMGFLGGLLGFSSEKSESQKAKEDAKEKMRQAKLDAKKKLKLEKDKVKASLVQCKSELALNQFNLRLNNKLEALKRKQSELKTQAAMMKNNKILYSESQQQALKRAMDKCAKNMDPEERDKYDRMRTQLTLCMIGPKKDKDGKDAGIGVLEPDQVKANFARWKKDHPESFTEFQREMESRGITVSDNGDIDPPDAMTEIRTVIASEKRPSKEELQEQRNRKEEILAKLEQSSRKCTEHLENAQKWTDKAKEAGKIEDEIKAKKEKQDLLENLTGVTGDSAESVKQNLKDKLKAAGVSDKDIESLDLDSINLDGTDLKGQLKTALESNSKFQSLKEKAENELTATNKKAKIFCENNGIDPNPMDDDEASKSALSDYCNNQKTKEEGDASKISAEYGVSDPKKLTDETNKYRDEIADIDAQIEEGATQDEYFEELYNNAKEEESEDDIESKENTNDAIKNNMDNLDKGEVLYDGKRGYWDKDKDGKWVFNPVPDDVEKMKEYDSKRKLAVVSHPENPGNSDKFTKPGDFAQKVDINKVNPPEVKRRKKSDGTIEYYTVDSDGKETESSKDAFIAYETTKRQRAKNEKNNEAVYDELESELDNLKKKKKDGSLSDEEQRRIDDLEKSIKAADAAEGDDWEDDTSTDSNEDDLDTDANDKEGEEVDDGNGGKKKVLKHPSKIWHKKKNKATGKTTKRYYNSDGSQSISAKEFNEKVAAWKKRKETKESVADDNSLMSFLKGQLLLENKNTNKYMKNISDYITESYSVNNNSIKFTVDDKLCIPVMTAGSGELI